jgi:pimeloyl-ACP methyl ester carboxylesterase
LPQFRTLIDGLGIHFLHVRSPHAEALPLVITHGWPGSILEFLNVLTRNELLDNIMLYWLPGAGASSARLYWESSRQVNEWISGPTDDTVDIPTGCSIFPKELQRPFRRWAEKRFLDIRYWNEPSRRDTAQSATA